MREGRERKEKSLLAHHTQWNVYVWIRCSSAGGYEDAFSEAPIDRTDNCRRPVEGVVSLSALHYNRVHYALHSITLH